MLEEKLEELRKLEKNWDSYGGEPIAESVLKTVGWIIPLFNNVMKADFAIVPTSNGGVSLEWHQGRKEVVLYLSLDTLGINGEMYITDGVHELEI